CQSPSAVPVTVRVSSMVRVVRAPPFARRRRGAAGSAASAVEPASPVAAASAGGVTGSGWVIGGVLLTDGAAEREQIVERLFDRAVPGAPRRRPTARRRARP